MKTILLFLLIQTRLFNYGLITQQWVSTPTNIFCYFEHNRINPYVDLKIQVVNERILSPIFIETNKGKFAAIVEPKLNKNGYSIIRLFYARKDIWVSIDSGITIITVKTDKSTHQILINDNLNKLKNYATRK